MSPLKPSPKVEGMLRFFENGKEDEDRSISQKRAVTKMEGRTLPRARKMEGYGVVAKSRITPVDPQRTFRKMRRIKRI
jgi:hypothetical protein